MKRLLITGGAGFIGSSLAVNFKKKCPTWEVIALDNLLRRGSEINLPILKKQGVVFVHGDIRNKEDLKKVGKIDILIECSAEPSITAGLNESPEYVINTNLIGTLNCLEMVRKNKADLIFLSTSRVYPIGLLNNIGLEEKENRLHFNEKQDIRGMSEQGISEEFSLEGARSIYGATKLCSEIMIKEYIASYGIKAIINRCGVIAGPGQFGKSDQGLVALWVASHVYGKPLSYIGYGGKGKQVRDVLHIDDLFDLIEIQLKEIDKHNGEVYNVGGGDINLSLKELTELCEKATGNKIEISSYSETRKNDIPFYVTDNSKIKQATGWYPKKTASDIVNDTTKWIKDNKDELDKVFF